jgi:high affinity Mn2+ porin
MTMPKIANAIDLDLRLDRARGQNLEAEVRPLVHGHQGVVRLLAYRNVADMGSCREAIDAFRAGRDPQPDITRHRRQGRTKTGYGISFEQEVTGAVRVFGRWGINDGHTESFAYTEVDGTVELGADLRLDNEKHKLSLVLVDNRLSNLHRTYLALGGLGFLLGDVIASDAHQARHKRRPCTRCQVLDIASYEGGEGVHHEWRGPALGRSRARLLEPLGLRGMSHPH